MSTSDPLVQLDRIRDLEAELAESWRGLRESRSEAQETSIEVLEVTVAELLCLIPVSAIREVVRIAWPQPLAESPPWIMGTIQYGSQTVPLVDLSLRLIDHATTVSRDLLIVVVENPRWLGLVVNQADRVIDVDPATMCSPAPETPFAHFVTGVFSEPSKGARLLLSPSTLGREIDG